MKSKISVEEIESVSLSPRIYKIIFDINGNLLEATLKTPYYLYLVDKKIHFESPLHNIGNDPSKEFNPQLTLNHNYLHLENMLKTYLIEQSNKYH
jgi:hypothetical protein